MTTLGLFQTIGWPEMLTLLVIGLLLFGRRLPEVGRSLGRGIVEFKRGLKGLDDDIEEESSRPAQSAGKPLPPQMGGSSSFQAPAAAMAGGMGAVGGAQSYETPSAPARAPDQRVSRSDPVD